MGVTECLPFGNVGLIKVCKALEMLDTSFKSGDIVTSNADREIILKKTCQGGFPMQKWLDLYHQHPPLPRQRAFVLQMGTQRATSPFTYSISVSLPWRDAGPGQYKHCEPCDVLAWYWHYSFPPHKSVTTSNVRFLDLWGTWVLSWPADLLIFLQYPIGNGYSAIYSSVKVCIFDIEEEDNLQEWNSGIKIWSTLE